MKARTKRPRVSSGESQSNKRQSTDKENAQEHTEDKKAKEENVVEKNEPSVTLSQKEEDPASAEETPLDDVTNQETDFESFTRIRPKPPAEEPRSTDAPPREPELKAETNKVAPDVKIDAKKEAAGDANADRDAEEDEEDKNTKDTEEDGKVVARCIKRKTVTFKDNQSIPNPSARWGHSMCLTADQTMMMIGGEGQKRQSSKDSIFEFAPENWMWEARHSSSGKHRPECRTGHSAVIDVMMKAIYVYGGSKGDKWYSDVNMLDLSTNKWKLVETQGEPPSRAYHSATLCRHEMWIFGGVQPMPHPQPDKVCQDLHVFSPLENNWSRPDVSGTPPEPRSGHSATLLGLQHQSEYKMVVFGGGDLPDKVYNDLHILDLGLVEWSTPRTLGPPPSPRTWHASCALTCNRLLVHGGFNTDRVLDTAHIFNLGTLSWSEIVIRNPLSARCGHTMTCQPWRPSNGPREHVYIFGGGDNENEFYDDMFRLSLPGIAGRDKQAYLANFRAERN